MSDAPSPRIAPSAVIGSRVEFGPGVVIEPYAIIHDGVFLGEGTHIGAHAIVGHPMSQPRASHADESRDTVIGKNGTIRSHSVIYEGCRFGDDFSTGHGAVIREFAHFGHQCVFGIHSVCDGYVQVGDHSRCHGHVGLAQDTVLGKGVLMYPHATTLDTLHPPCRKEARGPTLGDRVVVGAGSFIFARLRIGDDALIGCDSVVMEDVPSGKVVMGSPARVLMNASDVECRVVEGRRPYPFRLDDLEKR